MHEIEKWPNVQRWTPVRKRRLPQSAAIDKNQTNNNWFQTEAAADFKEEIKGDSSDKILMYPMISNSNYFIKNLLTARIISEIVIRP